MNIIGKDFVISCVSKLNEKQTKLFTDYGLRQIKYMFDFDSVMKSEVPIGATIVGISTSFMRWAALDETNKIRYGYFKGQNPEWSKAYLYNPKMNYDSIVDFKFIYDTF